MKLTDKKIIIKPWKYYLSIEVEKWDKVEKELIALEQQEINCKEALVDYINKYNELIDIISEKEIWNFIERFSDTTNKALIEAEKEFNENIVINSEKYFSRINKKIALSQYFDELPKETYSSYKRILINDIDIFNEENVKLIARENESSMKYREITSNLIVNFHGEEKTLQQMENLLKSEDRLIREKAWRLIHNKRLESKEALDKVFDELKEIRIKQAENAAFPNYRDYIHKCKYRFDYTPQDLIDFHKSIEKVVIPILREINEEKAIKLGVEKLRPWDELVDTENRILKPFNSTEELIDKVLRVLDKINADFAIKLNMMRNNGYLDLDNRKGKAGGGFSFTAENSGACFIMMNMVGAPTEANILLHEAGHAVHSYATAKQPIRKYRMMDAPSEVSELASMSMEFFSLQYYDEFYDDIEDIKAVKKEKLEGTLKRFRWVAMIDDFQHWLYTNPHHTPEERGKYFSSLEDRFDIGIDWTGLDNEKEIGWLKQIHVFTMPFYMIEYAIALLGAIALYKNYKENKDKTIDEYKCFMELGYSRPVTELYEAAGIKFDFSEGYLKEMINFIKEELDC